MAEPLSAEEREALMRDPRALTYRETVDSYEATVRAETARADAAEAREQATSEACRDAVATLHSDVGEADERADALRAALIHVLGEFDQLDHDRDPVAFTARRALAADDLRRAGQPAEAGEGEA